MLKRTPYYHYQPQYKTLLFKKDLIRAHIPINFLFFHWSGRSLDNSDGESCVDDGNLSESFLVTELSKTDFYYLVATIFENSFRAFFSKSMFFSNCFALEKIHFSQL